MSRWIRRFLLLLPIVGPLACSQVHFKAEPNKICVPFVNQFGANSCTLDPNGMATFKYSVSSGEVDILVVDDNSGSMYTEQTEMANRFPGFLDSIYRLDYHLAIITTDITNNPGGFLAFPSGGKVLWNNSRVKDTRHGDNVVQFQNTIKRPETLTCDSSGYTNCPSGDERGIYNLNLAMARSDQQAFFRPTGHLAVIILSDEDERSNGGNITGYALEDLDKPLTFAKYTKQYLGPAKSVSVHSIVIRPGDTQCFDTQNQQSGVKGFYANLYASLTNPSVELKSAGHLVRGALGNICSSNYTTELGNIASQIDQQTKTIQLPCKPEVGSMAMSLDPPGSPYTTYTIDSSNLMTLNPPAAAGVKVNLAFRCKL